MKYKLMYNDRKQISGYLEIEGGGEKGWDRAITK